MRRVQNRVELFEQLPRGSTGAELGVLDGLFSAQILKKTKACHGDTPP